MNMATMIGKNTKFPPGARSPPGKPDHQAIHFPTDYFGPLLRDIINPILITAFDTYLIPRSPTTWV